MAQVQKDTTGATDIDHKYRYMWDVNPGHHGTAKGEIETASGSRVPGIGGGGAPRTPTSAYPYPSMSSLMRRPTPCNSRAMRS